VVDEDIEPSKSICDRTGERLAMVRGGNATHKATMADCSARWSRRSFRLAVTTTSAPASRRVPANRSPRPEEAPVTRATRRDSMPISSLWHLNLFLQRLAEGFDYSGSRRYIVNRPGRFTISRPIGAGLATPGTYRIGKWGGLRYLPIGPTWCYKFELSTIWAISTKSILGETP
jgi:hypothetical protein